MLKSVHAKRQKPLKEELVLPLTLNIKLLSSTLTNNRTLELFPQNSSVFTSFMF